MQSIDGTYLAILCTHQAEADVVVAVSRTVVVAIRRTQVLRIVVPTAAPNDTVRARSGHYANLKDISKSFLLTDTESACRIWATMLDTEFIKSTWLMRPAI